MRMRSKKTPTVLACMIPLLVGCATCVPGDTPGPVPPRIVAGDDGRVWDHPSAFGKVPSELQAEGDAFCRGNDLKRAIGYHPDARDFNGNRFPKGGFFCVCRKSQRDGST